MRISLPDAAKLLQLPQLVVLQMTQGPAPVLSIQPTGKGLNMIMLDKDEVEELKAWMSP